MASVSGEAETQGRPSLMPDIGDTDQSSSRSRGGVVRLPGKEREAGTVSLTREASISDCGASVTVSSHHPHVATDNQDSDDDTHRTEDSDRRDFSSRGMGVLRLESSHSDSSSKEQDLWQKVESIMAARQSQVQQALEEFGISDVQPSSDQLEEQVWKVVQGELTQQEAADLV